MTEHVHEWNWFRYDGYYHCQVTGCDEKRHPINMEARLNATERLSAEDADGLASCARICSEGDDGLGYNAEEVRLAQCADGYANILEGKDERTKPIR